MQWARVRNHLTGKGEWWWAPLVYAIAIAWIYRDLWHQFGTPTALGWDTTDSYGPDLEFLARDFREGRFSLWNPYDHGGYSLVADIGFPRWYPVHWLFAGWGALFGARWWLIQVEVLAHHLIAACTMHAYLRARGVGRGGAVIGGVAFIASAPMLLHKASILLWPIAWAPLVLLAIDRVAARPGPRTGAWLGGAIALVGLAGSPPSTFYVLLLALPYGLVQIIAAIRAARGARRATLIRLATALAIGASITVCALAITLAPTHELLPYAQRAQMKGKEFALAAPLEIENTLSAMVAPTTGNPSPSLGAIAFGLALCALLLARGRERRVVIVLWVAALFGLVLAVGEHGHVLPWLVKHGPLFGRFRSPPRYRLITAIALAACAGMGADALVRAPRAWSGPRWLALAAAGAIVAAAAIAVVEVAPQVPPVPPFPREAHWSSVFALLAAIAIAALVIVPGRVRAWALAATAILVANDAPFFVHTPDSPPPGEVRRTHDGEDARLAKLGDVSEAYRLYDEFVFGERVGVRRRVRDFRGYPAVDPLSQVRYLDVIDRARTQPEILEAYNVRWVLHAAHFRDGLQACFVPVPLPEEHFSDRGDGVWEALHPAPHAAWYAGVRSAHEPDKLLDLVAAAEVGGQRTYATLEPPDTGLIPLEDLAAMIHKSEPGVPAKVTGFQPDAIDLVVDAPDRGVVVLNEVAYPGWDVTVDGAPAAPLRADYLLRGVYVQAGHHAIAWRFHPTGFRPLFALYALAMLAIVLSLGSSLVAPFWQRPRRRAAA